MMRQHVGREPETVAVLAIASENESARNKESYTPVGETSGLEHSTTLNWPGIANCR